MRKRIVIGCLLALFALLSAGCGGGASTGGGSAGGAGGETTSPPSQTGSSSSSQPAQEPVQVKLSFPVEFDINRIPADVAIEKGIWKEMGLEVEPVYFSGGSDQMRGVASGSVSLGLTSPVSMFNAAARGTAVKYIATTITKPAGWGLAVLPDSPIKQLSDLKGKSIAMSRPGSLTNWAAVQYVKAGGFQPGDATYVPAGQPEAELAALKSGQVDAAALEGTILLKASTAGEVRVVAYLADLVNVAYNGWFATDQAISQQRDTLEKLLQGWYQAVAYMNEDKAYTVDLLARVFKLDPEVAEELYDRDLPYFSTDGALDDEALAGAAQSLVELQMQESVPDISTMIDTSFTPVQVPGTAAGN